VSKKCLNGGGSSLSKKQPVGNLMSKERGNGRQRKTLKSEERMYPMGEARDKKFRLPGTGKSWGPKVSVKHRLLDGGKLHLLQPVWQRQGPGEK